jgi:hypothetical protein
MISKNSRPFSPIFSSALALALVSGISSGLTPLVACAESSAEAEADQIAPPESSVAVPLGGLDVLGGYLGEMVKSLDVNLEQSRESGYAVIEKYFGREAKSDLVVRRALIASGRELQLSNETIKANIYPKSPEGQKDLAMLKVVAREQSWRLLIGPFRSIRQIQVEKLSESSIFLDESLRISLNSNPLTYSFEKVGMMDIRPNGAFTWKVKVKFMPELEKYGASVDATYVIRRQTDGTFDLLDTQLHGISSMTMQFREMINLIRTAHKTDNLVADTLSSQTAVEAMDRFGLGGVRWNELAQDFAEKEPLAGTSIQSPDKDPAEELMNLAKEADAQAKPQAKTKTSKNRNNSAPRNHRRGR